MIFVGLFVFDIVLMLNDDRLVVVELVIIIIYNNT